MCESSFVIKITTEQVNLSLSIHISKSTHMNLSLTFVMLRDNFVNPQSSHDRNTWLININNALAMGRRLVSHVSKWREKETTGGSFA